MGNSNQTVICRECGTSLGSVSAQDEEVLLQKEIEKHERKQRRKQVLAYTGVILSGVLNVTFFIISIIRGTFLLPAVLFLFMPAMGYLFIFRPDAMFRYGYQNYIKNINDVKLTELYYFKSTFGGVFIMVLSTAMMGFIAFR
jgi:hypothetical protein